MATQNPSDGSPLGHSLSPTNVDTAGVVQSLRPDPHGRYIFRIVQNDGDLEFHVRADKRSDAWHKLREHRQDGAYVNTADCSVMGQIGARANDPQVAVYAKGSAPG